MKKSDLEVGLKVKAWAKRGQTKRFSVDTFTVLSTEPHWAGLIRFDGKDEPKVLSSGKFSRARSVKWGAYSYEGGYVLCENKDGEQVLQALGALMIASEAEVIIERQERGREAQRIAWEEYQQRVLVKDARDAALKATLLNALGLSEDDGYYTFGEHRGKVTVTVEALVKAGVLDIDASLLDDLND